MEPHHSPSHPLPSTPFPLTLITKDISHVKVAAGGWLWGRWVCEVVRFFGATRVGGGEFGGGGRVIGGGGVRWEGIESHLDAAVLKYRGEKKRQKTKIAAFT